VDLQLCLRSPSQPVRRRPHATPNTHNGKHVANPLLVSRLPCPVSVAAVRRSERKLTPDLAHRNSSSIERSSRKRILQGNRRFGTREENPFVDRNRRSSRPQSRSHVPGTRLLLLPFLRSRLPLLFSSLPFPFTSFSIRKDESHAVKISLTLPKVRSHPLLLPTLRPPPDQALPLRPQRPQPPVLRRLVGQAGMDQRQSGLSRLRPAGRRPQDHRAATAGPDPAVVVRCWEMRNLELLERLRPNVLP
jgi:hypothetical protein